MGGDDRLWWHTFNSSLQNIKKQGKMFLFDIESEIFEKLDLINYPYEYFHPLGIGLLKKTNNQVKRNEI